MTIRQRKFAAILSLAIGFAMLALKMGAYLLTGSAAILSDALESVVHVVATAFALYSVVVSARPADRSHPYGHGKVEFFSAGFEGALIMLAALAILADAVRKLIYGTRLESLDVGVVAITTAAVINLFLGLYLVRVGHRTNSLTLVADGRHVLTDSLTSIAVLVGLGLVMFTGWTTLDPLVAVAVAINILVAGGQLVYRSIHGLMDASDPDVLRTVVTALQERRRPGWIDIHRLRTLRIGDGRHVDLHLTVPRFWDVEKTHAEQEDVEKVIAQAFPGPTGLLTHLDPCVDACCTFCSYEPCPIRAAPHTGMREWNVDGAVASAAYIGPGKED